MIAIGQAIVMLPLVAAGLLLGGTLQGQAMVANAEAHQARIEALETAIAADGPDVLITPGPKIDLHAYGTDPLSRFRAIEDAKEQVKEGHPGIPWPQTAEEYEALPPGALWAHPGDMAIYQKPGGSAP